MYIKNLPVNAPIYAKLSLNITANPVATHTTINLTRFLFQADTWIYNKVLIIMSYRGQYEKHINQIGRLISYKKRQVYYKYW